MHPYRGEDRFSLLTDPRSYEGAFSDLPSHFSYICITFFEGREKVKLQLVTFHVDVLLESLVYVEYEKQVVFLS